MKVRGPFCCLTFDLMHLKLLSFASKSYLQLFTATSVPPRSCFNLNNTGYEVIMEVFRFLGIHVL